MRGIAGNMGLFWLRAGKRKKDVFYYIAWAMTLGPFLFAAFVLLTLPESRTLQQVVMFGGGLGVTLYLLRDYLPWVPRSRTQRILDAALPPPAEARPDGTLAPADPLLDPYDAVSGTGRWAQRDGRAVGELRFRIDPDPSLTRLRRATRAGVKAARRALGSGQGLHATGDLRRVPGPDIVAIGLIVRGPAASQRRAEVASAFEAAFRAELTEHQVKRTA